MSLTVTAADMQTVLDRVSEINNVSGTVGKILRKSENGVEWVADLSSTVSNHAENIASISGTVSNHTGDIASISGTVSNYTGDIASISGTVSNNVNVLTKLNNISQVQLTQLAGIVDQWPEDPTFEIGQIGSDFNGTNDNDQLGKGSAINKDGNIIVIGTPGFDSNMGKVQVYELNNGIWSTKGNPVEGEVVNTYFGSNVAINDNGTRIAVVSRPGNDSSASVSIFEYNTSTNNWEKVGQDLDSDSIFGVFGNTMKFNAFGNIIVFDHTGYGGFSHNGKVYVYREHVFEGGFSGNNTTISWVKIFEKLGDATNNELGWVSLNYSGNIVSMGSNNNDFGMVRVYKNPNHDDVDWVNIAAYNTSGALNWVQLGQDITGSMSGDRIAYGGTALNSSGDRLVVGARFSDRNNKSNSGHILVYTLIGNTWTQLGQTIEGTNDNEYCGWCPSINNLGNRIAFHVNHANQVNENARVYELTSSGEWTQILSNEINKSGVGDSSTFLSRDGNRMIISNHELGIGNKGRVSVFSLKKTFMNFLIDLYNIETK